MGYFHGHIIHLSLLIFDKLKLERFKRIRPMLEKLTNCEYFKQGHSLHQLGNFFLLSLLILFGCLHKYNNASKNG